MYVVYGSKNYAVQSLRGYKRECRVVLGDTWSTGGYVKSTFSCSSRVPFLVFDDVGA